MTAKIGESQFPALCQAKGLPMPVAEFRFHAARQWRFDWCWIGRKIALEIQGGAYHGPGHRSVGKYLRDIEKWQEAAVLGYRIVPCTTDQFNSGDIFQVLERIL